MNTTTAPSMAHPPYLYKNCVLKDVDEVLKSYHQDRLNKPKPWVGVYIAAASVVCSLAMAADVAVAFRTKRLWVPCNYFCLNALSLTLLSVATKLPLDFSGVFSRGLEDTLAHISSLALVVIAMAHFMTSLGSMTGNEMVANLTALGLLVFTIAGNLLLRLMQLFTTRPVRVKDSTGQVDYIREFESYTNEEIATAVCMLFGFMLSCSSAVMLQTAKKYTESRYQDKHKTILSYIGERWSGNLSKDNLKFILKRYWVMAETGSYQFVIARSSVSTGGSVLCLLTILTLLEISIRLHIQYNGDRQTFSDYKWSTIGIHATQCIAAIVGSIVGLLRLSMTAQFSCSKIRRRGFKGGLFAVEKYWTQLLIDWRESPLSFQIRHQKFKKLAHGAKRLLLKLCIVVQILIVQVSNLLQLIPAILIASACRCLQYLITKFIALDARESAGSESVATHDLRDFVVLHDDVEELPVKILKNMCMEMDRMIKKGRKKKLENLTKLLGQSNGFHGVREFQSKEVRSLLSPNVPNSWSLSVVTLTSVAIALASIPNEDSSELLSGVGEGLDFVKLIENTLDKNDALTNIKKAADVVWVSVDLDRKWLGKEIQAKLIPGDQSCQRLLQAFSGEAKNIVLDFIESSNEICNNWQLRAIAADSMYRITQTLMQDDKYGQWTEQELFDRLSRLISDILVACLTNLAHVICLKCYRDDIKERERSVHEAAILLGESEEILEILQQHQFPCMDVENAAYIDEWRAYLELDIENPLIHVSASRIQNATNLN